MKDGPDIAYIASLIGDPVRANMLTALMAGKALTASELAHEAGITLQTASSHLGKLEQGGLLIPRKQGRHKYFSLTSGEVAATLEALMGLAASAGHLRTRPGPKDAALREARVCYNHLAGEMGTRLFDAMVGRGLLVTEGEDVELSAAGAAFVKDFGIDLDALTARRAPVCKQCLDWSERRSHLAGSLGRALLDRFEALGWAKRDGKSRVVTFGPKGRDEFSRLLAG
ncbi:ArsR/SmtB family transcription factor [Pelagibacterium halotolerans]|nr:winged helix-turn-helix domain-containing protein [Pelagibacterium halotolerans]QJR19341.1 winged helix-turn-helix transcriptional regulator [Pelagibacterium halotolerans]SDZ94423.1 transcriptional regulator, ArsR family [Pelagibacterium halotolerans]